MKEKNIFFGFFVLIGVYMIIYAFTIDYIDFSTH